MTALRLPACDDCLDSGIDLAHAAAENPPPCPTCEARKNAAGNTEPVDARGSTPYHAPATQKRRSGLLPSRRGKTNR